MSLMLRGYQICTFRDFASEVSGIELNFHHVFSGLRPQEARRSVGVPWPAGGDGARKE